MTDAPASVLFKHDSKNFATKAVANRRHFEVLREFPSRRIATEHGELPQGLMVRLRVIRARGAFELDLGEAARFYPSDAALERWREAAREGVARVAYEHACWNRPGASGRPPVKHPCASSPGSSQGLGLQRHGERHHALAPHTLQPRLGADIRAPAEQFLRIHQQDSQGEYVGSQG